ncbi:MAG: 2-dehydropantoate 2-reductase [Anaeromyxobacteraceae bacterium]
MRIAIVGAGGVGGLLAGLLARSGVEVGLVVRGAGLAAIRAEGLRVDSTVASFTVPPDGFRGGLADAPSGLAPADAVLLAVKAWQVEAVAPTLAPLLAPRRGAQGGFAVPLQNGVLSAGRLLAALPAGQVVGGLAHMLSWVEAPGRVKHVGAPPRVTTGELGAGKDRPSSRLEALAGLLRAAGAEAIVEADVERAAWEKFALVEPWGTVAAAARTPCGPLRAVPEARALLEAAVREVVAVGRARGVPVPDETVARVMARIDASPPDATVSMQRDLAAGLPSELEDQPGALVRLAREAGVPVPVHDALYAALLPMERAARGAIPAFRRT